MLELFLEHLSRKYKVNTIKRKLSCVQSLFTYLEWQELVEDSPFRRFRVHLQEGKAAPKSLTVLEQEVQQVLEAYFKVRRTVPAGHSYLFLSRFQEPLSTQGVRNLVDKYAKIAGINKRVTPHVFRHSFATLLLESGVDIKYVQDFLGHSSISTTQIYLHLSEESKRQVLAAHHPRSRMEVSGHEIV